MGKRRDRMDLNYCTVKLHSARERRCEECQNKNSENSVNLTFLIEHLKYSAFNKYFPTTDMTASITRMN